MRKLLLLSCLFISTSLLSQKDTSATPLLDKTEHLVDKYSSKIADAFMSTMENAKPLAKEGFESVVMLQIAKGIGMLLPLLFLFVFIVMFNSEYNRIDTILKSDKIPAHMYAKGGPFEEDNVTPKLILNLIGLILCSIMTFIFTYDGVLHLLSPKWFAIKEIIELFK
jgi:hypothetical protein